MAISVGVTAGTLAACQGSSIAPLSQTGTFAEARIGDTDGDLTVVAALSPPPNPSGPARIAIGDLLNIDVFNVDELDRQSRVGPHGTISMPLVGDVQAEGRTPSELEDRLEAAYDRDYLRDPDITVSVVEAVGLRITLDGQFRRPGLYDTPGRTSLLQAVAGAGGLTEIADDRRIYVFREVGGGRQVASYSVAAIRNGRAPDPQLFGGDVVIAFASGTRVAARNLREALGLAGSATGLVAPF